MYAEIDRKKKVLWHNYRPPLFVFLFFSRFHLKSTFVLSIHYNKLCTISLNKRWNERLLILLQNEPLFLLRASGMSQHEISRKLNISRNCIHQTIDQFNKLHTVATKTGAGRRSKLTDRQKRAIKLQQVRDDTLSLNDLIRYVQTSFNITVSHRTVSRILNEFDMFSYIAPRKPRINYRQRYARLQWCYQHLSWAEKDWSNVIFTDESNFEILNRKNRIYIRRFRNDLKRFETISTASTQRWWCWYMVLSNMSWSRADCIL